MCGFSLCKALIFKSSVENWVKVERRAQVNVYVYYLFKLYKTHHNNG